MFFGWCDGGIREGEGREVIVCEGGFVDCAELELGFGNGFEKGGVIGGGKESEKRTGDHGFDVVRYARRQDEVFWRHF